MHSDLIFALHFGILHYFTLHIDFFLHYKQILVLNKLYPLRQQKNTSYSYMTGSLDVKVEASKWVLVLAQTVLRS